MTRIRPVILAGGPGARLWPLSDARTPKPFLKIDGERTLLDQTIARFAAPDLFAEPIIACLAAQAERARAALAAADVAAPQLILEPEPRDTAAAIAAIAAARAAEDADELVLIAPADHVIADAGAFREGCRRAGELAAKGRLVLFGATPKEPNTGFGYIEAASDAAAAAIASFQEKPDRARAEAFLAGGRHLWNMGLFLAPASTFLALFEAHAPDILAVARNAVGNAARTGGDVRLDPGTFANAPRAAFDRAVVEKTEGAMVVRLDCGWSDVGAWDAVLDALAKDAQGVAAVGDAHLIDVRDSLVHASGVTVAAIGVEGLVVVATPEAVLVCRREDAQRVKALVEAMKRDDGDA